MIPYETWLVFAVIIFLLLSLYKEWFSPAITFFIVIIALTAFGILTPQDALIGFSNHQLAVIVLLLVFSEIIRRTSIINLMFNTLFRGTKSSGGFMTRMMIYVSGFSAIFNNTPLVAMMMPYVYSWSRKNNISPSKLLIPLSYAAILGGTVTLVGTSTNLIVDGMAVEAGYDSLEIFDFAWVGLPMLVIGIIYLVIFGKRLLPDNKEVIEDFVKSSREYFIETHITDDSDLVGKSIGEAGLRHLKGIFLVEVIRGDHHITPVSPEEILEKDDRLIFAGATDVISELTKPTIGLSIPKESEISEYDKAHIVEVVISYNSRFIGNKVQDTDFRGMYDAVIVAVHRNKARLSGKIGDVELHAGDVLLLIAGDDFHKRIVGVQAFYVISTEEETKKVNPKKVLVIVTGIITAIALAAFKIMPLFTSLMILLGVVLLMKVVPFSEIRKSMDYSLIFILALGLALGKAMINSGAAELVANGVLTLVQPFGPIALLAAIFIVANLISAFVTNAAAAALIFPISMSIAQTMNVDITPFILVVAYGVGTSFITPIGYQTNLMVLGPGGYSFKDFFKTGLPLTIIYMIVCVLVLSYVYKLY